MIDLEICGLLVQSSQLELWMVKFCSGKQMAQIKSQALSEIFGIKSSTHRHNGFINQSCAESFSIN